MSHAPGSSPAPGWYDDPRIPGQLRWWDGSAWTANVHSPTDAPLGMPPAAATAAPYRSAAGRSRVLLASLVILGLIDAASIPAHAVAPEADIDGLWALSFLATVVVFLMWFRRMYDNLPALGAPKLRYTGGWAVGAWFIPFFNYVRPMQIASDISRASDPDHPDQLPADWNTLPVDPLVQVWWGLWVVMNVTYSFIAGTTTGAQLSDALELGALALCAAVVVRLTRQQEQRHARLANRSVDGAGTPLAAGASPHDIAA